MTRRGMRLTLAATLSICAAWSVTCRAASEPPAPVNTAAALYDAGNAQARLGRWAPAVLDYERAQLLAPHDPDIAANLRHVREAAGLPSQTGGWLRAHEQLASPDTLYRIGLIGLLCLGASLVALRATRRRTPRSPRGPFGDPRALLRAVAILGGVLTQLGVGDAIAVNSLLQQFVVFETSPATGSPVTNGAPLFLVRQADTVQVRGRHQGFLLIRDSQGRQGWVSRTRLAAVVPQDDATRDDH